LKTKILVIEDEIDISELVVYNLKKEGFLADSIDNGEEALKKIQSGEYNLIILDLMLPGISGIELCRILKNDPQTFLIPIIMLTAKGEEIDKVIGLEMGADDYITKPFSPRELIARVRAVLRRVHEKPLPGKTVKIGDLEINADTYQVSKRGTLIKPSATEFKLLLYLVQRKGKVFNRDMLLDAVWKNESYVEPRTVDVHIRRLREQIEDDPSHPVYIRTRRGIGYYVDGDL